MPLAPIPLTAESYQLDSTPAAQHRALNMFAEALPTDARSKHYLKSTPGLVQAATTGAGPVYTTAAISGSFFAIAGSRAYCLLDDGSTAATDLGSVGTVSSDYYHTSLAIGLVGPVFCVPPNAYVGDFLFMPVAQITTGAGNWPASGVSSVCYLDGYYIFTSFDGSTFFTSDLLSPSVFSGVSFVALSSEVDFFEHCCAFKRELWMFGPSSTSVWYNSGDPTTPFAPRTGAVMRPGCGSYRTITELNGSLFFLGVDGVVYRTTGSYQLKRVSTHALEELISGYDDGYLRTISACAFSHDGHEFYSLQLPVIGRSFVYDCSTDKWHERSSSSLGTGIWSINTATQLGARWLLGDSANGLLWHIDGTLATEKGVAVKRLAQLPALVSHGPRAFMSRIEFEMEVGIGGASTPVTLSWSDDGGTSYNAGRALATGAASARKTRVFTTRLGSFRQRVLRLTSAGQLTVYGANADMGAGDS
jgi:hypothetical protein